MQKFTFDANEMPKHIAIIMDGNGRWAKEKAKPRVFGHRKGVNAVRKVITQASKLGIKVISLFAFSTENWYRPKQEVNLLMDLFMHVLSKEIKKMHENNLCLRVTGDVTRFSEKLQQKIYKAQQLTINNTGTIVNIAANYGGKWDIANAMQIIANKIEQGSVKAEDVTENLISQHLTMSDLPDVDLFIRTSGECRISNFMLWQLAYAEIYFTQQYWPDFNEESLLMAIDWFVNRERRFGCTSEQLTHLI